MEKAPSRIAPMIAVCIVLAISISFFGTLTVGVLVILFVARFLANVLPGGTWSFLVVALLVVTYPLVVFALLRLALVLSRVVWTFGSFYADQTRRNDHATSTSQELSHAADA